MQSVSQAWEDIYSNPSHKTEYKLTVNGVEYGLDSLVSLQSSCDVFQGSAPIIGQCIASQMKASLYLPSTSIPRRAECKVYVRLTLGSSVSEWIEQGTYYIDKRRYNKTTGVLTLETFDSMMKTDKLMYTTTGQQEFWPKIDIEVVQTIAEDFLGVELDSNTETYIDQEYEVQYPGFGDGGFTVRQVLGYVGAMYGGNWIIDDTNHLKLLPLATFPSSAGSVDHVISDDFAEDYEELIPFQTISRVTIDVGTDEQTGDPVYYTSGDDTEAEFEFECPWGTQDMADHLLSELSTFVYYPYILTNALINPAFELWDGLLTSGVYSGITCYTRYFDPDLFTADISATGEDEIDSEYPYISRSDLVNKQSTANTTAKLIVTNNAINVEVTEARAAEAHLQGSINGINDSLDGKQDVIDSLDNIPDVVKQEISNQIDISASGLEARITEVQGNLDNYIKKIEGYIFMGLKDDTVMVELGQTTNDTVTRFAQFTPSGIYFFQGGGSDPVYWMAENKLFINESVIKQKLKLGGYELDLSNGIIMKWVGDN